MGDPADEPGPASQRGYAGRSIRRRTARRFPARRHASIEPCRLLCVDQPHGALDQPFGAEERLVGGCDHIDDGIADRTDIQRRIRSEEHTSELQSLMRISYAVFCLKKKKPQDSTTQNNTT